MSRCNFPADQYELLDFGEGRKLERFGDYLLDRPSRSAATADKARRSLWAKATAHYGREPGTPGRWQPADCLPDRWTVSRGALRFELKASPYGHVGLFPEQAPCWDWIAGCVQTAHRPLVVLNLFAYTGGSTLAAAQAGAAVVHVDAARNSVSRARENARASQLADAPIRWICDDALRFVRREVRRGNHYDGIIIDPPTYGHGPRGERWKLEKDLPALLETCGRLMQFHAKFLLLTCHTAGYGTTRAAPRGGGSHLPRPPGDRLSPGPATESTDARHRDANRRRTAAPRSTDAGLGPASQSLRQCLADAVPSIALPDVELGPLTIDSTTGRRLACGVFVRWKQP